MFLIRPSKYDDDGYVLRHWRGVLPSNSLAVLHALTLDVARRSALGPVRIRVHLCDESVAAVPERAIRRAARRPRHRAIVCLVGVQTSQFPRATVLALRFRAQGLPVLIGGFHVSGSLAMLPARPPELQALLDRGVTLVAGEVESAWETILTDAVAGRLLPVYDLLDARPDIAGAPVPRLDNRVLRRFVYRRFATLDAGRGCPFACSFCTIINVQGRAMRARSVECVLASVQANQQSLGTWHYFFTDDNFARHPDWRGIFRGLIRLRETGRGIRFLMQADLLAHRLPDFARMARDAGCFQVFLGMESLDPGTLRDTGKRQNRVTDYAALVRQWQDAGILVHVGYIIGFPNDTREGVARSVRELQGLGVDVASFFMLCPLPGSADHVRILNAGVPLDADLGRYDTFHPVMEHPRMSRAEWVASYREAWEAFYEPAHMQARLAAVPPGQRVTLAQIYLWYRSATVVERFHPMMTGFFRLKPRRDRRQDTAIEGRFRHLRRRCPEVARTAAGQLLILRELRALWDASVSAKEPRGWAPFLSAMFRGEQLQGRAVPASAPPYRIETP